MPLQRSGPSRQSADAEIGVVPQRCVDDHLPPTLQTTLLAVVKGQASSHELPTISGGEIGKLKSWARGHASSQVPLAAPRLSCGGAPIDRNCSHLFSAHPECVSPILEPFPRVCSYTRYSRNGIVPCLACGHAGAGLGGHGSRPYLRTGSSFSALVPACMCFCPPLASCFVVLWLSLALVLYARRV